MKPIDLINLFRRHFPESEIGHAMRITWCESRWKPDAVGNLKEIGLFQIHPTWKYIAQKMNLINLFDPEQNAQFAAYLFQHGGWALHWVHCSRINDILN